MQSSVYTADAGGGTSQGLVGRSCDVNRIEDLLGSVDSGGAVLLSGDPGVGRTALLGHLAHRALAAGARVLRAAGTESERDVEYAALNQLLFPLWEQADAQDLDRAHHEALRVALGFGEGTPPERYLVSNAALVLLRRAAATTPVLLVVDDIQAVDRASAAVLGFVARRLAGSRVRLLAAARRGHRGCVRAGVRAEHEVAPLDDEASRLLVGAVHPDLAGPVAECVVAAAQGNPLALIELPAALTGPQRAGLERRPPVLQLTRRLREVFGSGVADLPAATRRLLLVTALEGTGDLAVVECAARRLGAGADLADLEYAERDGLVRIEESDHRLSFRHPLFRAAVIDASTSAERRRVHRELAEILHDRPDQRAWHLGEACVEQDEDVASLLEGTAHRALRRGDAMAAIRVLTKAAHLSPGAADRGRRLAAAAYIRADSSGELAVASRLLDDARRIGSDDRASLYAAAVAVHRLLDGEADIDTAHRMLLGAIENTGRHGACDPALEEALHLLLMLCCLGGREELWAPLHKIMERLGPDVPPLLAVNVATHGDPARTALPALGDLEDLVAALPEETAPARITRIGTASIAADRFSGVRDAVSRVPAQGRRRIVTLPLLCTDAFLTGRWDDTTAMADEGLRLCKEHAFEAVSWYFRYYKALVAAARGEADVAEETADAMATWGASRGARHLVTLAEHIRVVVAQGEGDFERAYRHAGEISPAGELAPYTPVALLVVGDMVEAAVRTQRPAQAAAHVAAARHAGIARLSPRRAMLVDASAATAAEADEEAIELFERALSHAGVQQWPFDLARVTLAYGERLRKARSTTDARAPLSAALAAFEQLGARPWAERAKRSLQATGWMVRRAEGPESVGLTPQELEIAHLAASGLTNKQIAERLYLSPRTVGGHLGRVFPKLGITSRAALRDALTGLAKR